MSNSEKKSFAERMVSAGDSMQDAGGKTAKAGCGLTALVLAIIVVAVIAVAFVAC